MTSLACRAFRKPQKSETKTADPYFLRICLILFCESFKKPNFRNFAKMTLNFKIVFFEVINYGLILATGGGRANYKFSYFDSKRVSFLRQFLKTNF
jgi:hypothetical protein